MARTRIEVWIAMAALALAAPAALAPAAPAAASTWPRPRVEASAPEARVVLEDHFAGQPARPLRSWLESASGALVDAGWPWSRVAADTSEAGPGWTLRVRSGPRLHFGRIELRVEDPQSKALFERGSGLHTGTLATPAAFDRAVRRGLSELSDRGHAFASATVLDQRTDPATGTVDVVLRVRPGPVVSIREVRVVGTLRTRPEVLARLSGLRAGHRISERSLGAAADRLLSREGLVDAIEETRVVASTERDDQADVVLVVRQSPARGAFSAAAGVVRTGEGGSRLSGELDLQFFDLFGTARRFAGRWMDDGRSRRRLDLQFLEPGVFSTPLDVRLGLGQRHEDAAFDLVQGQLDLALPTSARRRLELSVGADRTTFEGALARTRWRQRAGARFGVWWPRGSGKGFFGAFETAAQAARVRDVQRPVEGADRVEATTTQTLVEVDARWGRALGRVIALQSDLGWRSTESSEEALPRSELWPLGGAATVRGHAEERFLGERVAFLRSELRLGPPRAGQGYLFFDYGWVRTSAGEAAALTREERWLRGYGIGVESPTTLGLVDLSLGFADGIGLDAGKLHLRLERRF